MARGTEAQSRDRSGIGRLASPQPDPVSVGAGAQWARLGHLLNQPRHRNSIASLTKRGRDTLLSQVLP